jgi:hypothetical protein
LINTFPVQNSQKEGTLSPLFFSFALLLTKAEENKGMGLKSSFWFVVMKLIC